MTGNMPGPVTAAHAAGKRVWDELAWLADDDAWAPVDVALWAVCNSHGIAPRVRDKMNREIRRNLRDHAAVLAAQAVDE